ncbi:hypothetical protein [Eel River basin pequenovirus]|uniref:hypothetical protein n=1 Tax=Eel River basin pequenovirus TaxID=1609634 RepID=UPI0005B2492E|nr:hypothetical protein [Eel River basin pequenovirus]AJK28214.1 hypothetical protein [Eel River basin pequenovirus]
MLDDLKFISKNFNDIAVMLSERHDTTNLEGIINTSVDQSLIVLDTLENYVLLKDEERKNYLDEKRKKLDDSQVNSNK